MHYLSVGCYTIKEGTNHGLQKYKKKNNIKGKAKTAQWGAKVCSECCLLKGEGEMESPGRWHGQLQPGLTLSVERVRQTSQARSAGVSEGRGASPFSPSSSALGCILLLDKRPVPHSITSLLPSGMMEDATLLPTLK